MVLTAPRFGKPTALAKGTAAATKPAQAATANTSLVHDPGDILFRQGDPGGDLFFIEDGQIEIFTQKGDQEIILATMTRGEIIGVMTCMTSEPRMASARSKTRSVCKRVSHQSIKKVIAALPNWMKIVVKEFSLRLNQMNQVYSDSVVQIRKLSETQANSLFYGSLISSAFSAISDYFAVDGDNYKIVIIEDVLSKLEFVLNMEKQQLDRIFAVLLEAGLLKLEMEPDKKRTVCRLENAKKLAYFAQFVKEMRHGAAKKLIKARFSNKEIRVMSGIVKLAVRMDVDLDKPCRLQVEELGKTLEKATGIAFDRQCLKKGEALKLLAVEGEVDGQGGEVVFRPQHLGRTVACIEAVRKLQAFDGRIPLANEDAA